MVAKGLFRIELKVYPIIHVNGRWLSYRNMSMMCYEFFFRILCLET